MGVGDKIRFYRELNGLKQSELAELADIPLGTLKKYEINNRNPKADPLRRIAAALNVYPSAFCSVYADDDILPYIIKILQSGQAEIHGKKGADGKYDADSITISFGLESIKTCLKNFADTKEILENLRVEASRTEDEKAREFMLKRAEEIEREFEWNLVRKRERN